MDNILIFSAAVVTLMTLIFTGTLQFHMLQQNSYFYSRFFDHLRGSVKLSTYFSVIFAAFSALFCPFFPLLGLIFTAVSCAIRILHAIYVSTHAKVKIKFTARVKRMYITLFILLAAAGVLAWFAPRYGIILSSLMLAASPFVIMLVNLINAPFEHAAKRWYINDAKRILRQHNKMTIIALTGSYGKTSTKYILTRLLGEKYNVTMTPGNFNTPMGVTRTIRENLKADSDIFVVEMGAKNVGDIKEICDIVHADYGIITSVGPQHLNTFGSIENVAKTKFELADDVCAYGGTVYLNIDNEYIREKSGEYNYKGYGVERKNGYVYAENVCGSKHGLSFDIVKGDERFSVSTKLLGSHNVLNILAAVSVALDLGVGVNDIKYALERLKPAPHRLELKPLFNGAVLIDDAYNANPAGSLEAMRVIGSFAPMKRIVVTPGLVELGEREYECNKALGRAAAENADEIYFVGLERSKPLLDGANETDFDKSKLHVVAKFTDALDELRQKCDKDTVVIFENDLPDTYAK